ncbi:hypothetical protein DFH28DRAFT_920606 [Melampsora americana]|nr:hypothetical protein DFH28DRAFT_920606 [Melampsora americana]
MRPYIHNVILGIATGSKTDRFGLTNIKVGGKMTESIYALHGKLNWYDCRVRTMRASSGRCHDCECLFNMLRL